MINEAVGCKSLDHQSAQVHLYGRPAKLDEDTRGSRDSGNEPWKCERLEEIEKMVSLHVLTCGLGEALLDRLES